MIRRSPAENYYKYLVVHPRGYINLDCKNIARELGLDYLGDWYIDWLRQRTRPPQPFYPEDPLHRESQRFLIREGLEKVFNPDAAMNQAMRVLARPRWREVVETLLLSRAPVDAIVYALKTRQKAKVSTAAIARFKHYFWDVDVLDSVEMRTLLELRHQSAFDNDTAAVAQAGAIHKMRHTDPRVVAARLPNTPLASMLAQLELGVMPKKIDLAQVAEATFGVALLRTYDAVMHGGPGGAQTGMSFAQIADVMGRIKSTVTNPEDKLRDDLKRIAISTTPKTVPTIKQLSDGQHTTNLHPEPKAEPESVVDAEFEEADDDEIDSNLPG